jgi:PAT family beta-lactamase induction signal transducer AmpG
MGLCNMVTGVLSGHLQEMMGYVSYFVFVMVATIPSFLATWFAPFHHDDGMGTGTGAGTGSAAEATGVAAAPETHRAA